MIILKGVKMKYFVFLILFSFSTLASASIDVATFNIKWIGYSSDRDNVGLAEMLADRDVVFVQELVSPPYEGAFPNGEPYKPDKESKDFFNAMKNVGFSYALSPSDTGPIESNGNNSSSTEWFVVFFKKELVSILEHNYIESDITNNQFFKRVPYRFLILEKNRNKEFEFVSTHLNPGNSLKDRGYRKKEINRLIKWSTLKSKPLIILGDMNIYDCNRFENWLSNNFKRVTKNCEGTNLKKDKPYDQVIYKGDIKIKEYKVVDLYDSFNMPRDTYWRDMSAKYSDHHPIFFTID